MILETQVPHYSIYERLGLSKAGSLPLYQQPFLSESELSVFFPDDVRKAYDFFKDKFFCSFQNPVGKPGPLSIDRHSWKLSLAPHADVSVTPYGAPVVAQNDKIFEIPEFAQNLEIVARYEASNSGQTFNTAEFFDNLQHLKTATPTRASMAAHYQQAPLDVLSQEPFITINPGCILIVTIPNDQNVSVLYSERNWPKSQNGTRQGPCGIADGPIFNAIISEANEEMAIVVVGEEDGETREFLILLQHDNVAGISATVKHDQWHIKHGSNPDVYEQVASKLSIDLGYNLYPEIVPFDVVALPGNAHVNLNIVNHSGEILEAVSGLLFAEPNGAGLAIDRVFDLTPALKALIEAHDLTKVRMMVAEPESFNREMGLVLVQDLVETAKTDTVGNPMILPRMINALDAVGLSASPKAIPRMDTNATPIP